MKLTVTLVAEKVTPNMVRYKTDEDSGRKDVIVTAYLDKAQARNAAPAGDKYPEYLYVTIDTEEPDGN